MQQAKLSLKFILARRPSLSALSRTAVIWDLIKFWDTHTHWFDSSMIDYGLIKLLVLKLLKMNVQHSGAEAIDEFKEIEIDLDGSSQPTAATASQPSESQPVQPPQTQAQNPYAPK